MVSISKLINTKFHFSSVATIFSRFLSFGVMGVMFVAVARYLGPQGQGTLSALVAFITIALQFGNLGLYASNIRFVCEDPKLFSKAASNSLTLGFTIGFILAILLTLSYLISPQIFEGIPFPLLIIYSFSIPFSLLTMLFQGLLLSVSDIFRYNILIIGRGLTLFFGVLSVIHFNGTLTHIVYVLVLVEALFAFFYILSALHFAKFSISVDIPFIKKMAGYGFKVFLATQLTYLVLKFDIIMVNFFNGAFDAGVYSISSKAADVMKMVPETIALLYFPKAAALGDAARPFTKKVLYAVAALMFIICGVSFILVTPLTPILLGPHYLESILSSLILLPGIFFIGLEVVLMNYYAARGMPWDVVAIPFIGLTANVLLNIIFLPTHGFVAAAFTSSFSYFLMFTLLYVRFTLHK